MWDLIVLVPDHCLSFYFATSAKIFFIIIVAFTETTKSVTLT